MSANQRVIITNEDDDAKVSVTERGITKAALAVEVLNAFGEQVTDFGGSASAATSVGQGNGTVANSGTAVQVSTTSVTCKRVWIQCNSANGLLTNEGLIVVGGSGVVATEANRTGRALYPTQGDWFNVADLNLLYVNALDSGAKFHYAYEA